MNLPLVQSTPLAEDEIQAAITCLRSGRVTQGEKVAEFERVFAEAHGYPADRAVFCNSGSSANLLAVSALDLKPGEEVIVPAVTWPTQVWPIVQCGGVPVLVDVDPSTLQSDQKQEYSAYWEQNRDVERPEAKFLAVFRAHLLGNPAWIISRGPGVAAHPWQWLLEDCCEALGSMLGKKAAGTFGRFGTFSFYLSHHITTIEGGMVLCRDAQDADRLRVTRNHGMSRHLSPQARQDAERAHPDIDPRFLFLEPGYNLRGTDVAAAIGLAQWPKREAWAARRREIATYWTEGLDREVFQPVKWAPGAVPFAFPLVLRPDRATYLNVKERAYVVKPKRPALIRHLKAAGIETRPLLAGNIARQPAMRKVRHRIAGPLTGADVLHTMGLYIGLSPALTDAQVEYLPQVLKTFK